MCLGQDDSNLRQPKPNQLLKPQTYGFDGGDCSNLGKRAISDYSGISHFATPSKKQLTSIQNISNHSETKLNTKFFSN